MWEYVSEWSKLLNDGKKDDGDDGSIRHWMPGVINDSIQCVRATFHKVNVRLENDEINCRFQHTCHKFISHSCHLFIFCRPFIQSQYWFMHYYWSAIFSVFFFFAYTLSYFISKHIKLVRINSTQTWILFALWFQHTIFP